MKTSADITAENTTDNREVSTAGRGRTEGNGTQDVYGVFHLSVDKLHGVWKDVLSRSEAQQKQMSESKKAEAKKDEAKKDEVRKLDLKKRT